jgi:hypothetical protein
MYLQRTKVPIGRVTHIVSSEDTRHEISDDEVYMREHGLWQLGSSIKISCEIYTAILT